MGNVVIIWDLEDDRDGNYWHITEGHDVTADEVDEVLRNYHSQSTTSRSSGNPITFGPTSTGKHIAVVYEHVDDYPLTLRPITAYQTPPPRRKKHGR
jgi:hypothetical protein